MGKKKATGERYSNKVMTADGEKIRKELWLKEDILNIISHLAIDCKEASSPKEYMELLIINHAKNS